MNNLSQITLKEAISGIKKKEFKRRELMESVLERIRTVEDKIFSFTTVCNGLVESAKNMDENEDNTELSGIPFAVKDVLSTKAIRTSASSKILDNYFPSYDATVVKKLKEKGALVIGKTNCDAFAFGASTENSGFGPTKNPWDLRRVPGGSSGGSATAVATDECIFALGTDTGGSIRQPASFCGITGLKPTYGACSRYGLLAMASSFDCPGPMGKTVEDCEIVFNIVKGKDPLDATSSDRQEVNLPVKKNDIVLGLPKEFFTEGVDKEVKDSVLEAGNLLSNNGYKIREISLRNTSYCVPVYYILVPSEISSNMARYTGMRFGRERELFEDEIKRRIMIGTFALSAGYFDQYYQKASKARNLIQKDYLKAFKEVDVILAPVSPTPAFKLGEKTNNPVQMYLCDVLTVGANLTGIPGLALPCGFNSSGLPIGMQLLGPHFSEKLLFDIGKQYQQITDWHKIKPKII